MPLIDFGDMDRDAMTDMIFFANESIHTYYNRYPANSAYTNDLCKDALDGAYLRNNLIFTPPNLADFD